MGGVILTMLLCRDLVCCQLTRVKAFKERQMSKVTKIVPGQKPAFGSTSGQKLEQDWPNIDRSQPETATAVLLGRIYYVEFFVLWHLAEDKFVWDDWKAGYLGLISALARTALNDHNPFNLFLTMLSPFLLVCNLPLNKSLQKIFRRLAICHGVDILKAVKPIDSKFSLWLQRPSSLDISTHASASVWHPGQGSLYHREEVQALRLFIVYYRYKIVIYQYLSRGRRFM